MNSVDSVQMDSKFHEYKGKHGHIDMAPGFDVATRINADADVAMDIDVRMSRAET